MRRRSEHSLRGGTLLYIPETVAAPLDFSGVIGLRLSLLSILNGSEWVAGVSFELFIIDCCSISEAALVLNR